MPFSTMGLPLYNPSQSTSCLLSDPIPQSDLSWRSQHAPPKNPANITTHYSLVAFRPWDPEGYTLLPRRPDTKQEMGRVRPIPTQKRTRPYPERWEYDAREGRDLLRSLDALPRRPPSLERQEAFCSERGAKKRNRHESGLEGGSQEAEDERELYRLGLLYDNPHERGEAFTFDAIVHEEPEYSVQVRSRKRGKKVAQVEALEQPEGVHFAPLPLELSFAELKNDEDVARLMEVSDGDGIRDYEKDTPRRSSQRDSGTQLTVIYELEREDMLLPETQCAQVVDSEGGSDWEVLSDDGSTAASDAWVKLG